MVAADTNSEPLIPSPEGLLALLLLAVKRGARASSLLQHAPELVEALCPERRFPGLDLSARAFEAERDIRAAIDSLDDNLAGYLLTVLALAPNTYRVNLTVRLETAGSQYFGIGVRMARSKKWK